MAQVRFATYNILDLFQSDGSVRSPSAARRRRDKFRQADRPDGD
ncbi:hypothetical protein [Frankia sp. AiPs1]|nr:hypothetical protein [Frankia sp. AiPs1]